MRLDGDTHFCFCLLPFCRFGSLCGSGWQDSMAYAVAEVFSHNHALCLKIRQEHIEVMVEILGTHTLAVPNVLGLLEAIVFVEEFNLPLKRNQVCQWDRSPLKQDRSRLTSRYVYRRT